MDIVMWMLPVKWALETIEKQEELPMNGPTQYPLLVFAISMIGLWLSAWIGWWFRKRQGTLDAELRDDFGFILAATLTLLGLIIGFSFSMATSRYDQRKKYRRRRPTLSGRNTSGPTCCLKPMRPAYGGAERLPGRAHSLL